MITKFNEFLLEAFNPNKQRTPALLISKIGVTDGFTKYEVLKDDERYGVALKKDTPFKWKYQGRVDRSTYKGGGRVVKNPSKLLIVNSQELLKPIPNSKREDRKNVLANF
jgi:hypothetical protein